MSAPVRAILVSLVMLPGCLDLGGSWDATSATATAAATGSTTSASAATEVTSSTSSSSGEATSTTGDASTSASSTSDPAICPELEVFVCRLDMSGECGPESSCEYLDKECVLGECSEDCEGDCRAGWDCVDAGTAEMLVCARNYDEGCDIWDSDCPEGTKCMPWANDGGSSWNATKCAPLDPEPVGPGEACVAVGGGVSGIDNCDEGSMCWDVNPETNIGYCVAFCEGEHNMPICDAGLLCAIPGAGIPVLCLPGCDPLDPHCFGDDLCVPGNNYAFWCAQDDSGSSGDYGTPCEEVNTCDPGLLCLPVADVPKCEAESCCSPYCDLGEPNTCPGLGQACIPFFDPEVAPEHYKHVGYCGIEG